MPHSHAQDAIDVPDTSTTQHTYLPLFLDVRDETVVIIGGGVVASRKVDTILRYGAQVTVIAPRANEHIIDLTQQGLVAWERRPYREGDLAGACLAVCACGVHTVDKAVADEARKRCCPINVVDQPALCSFIVPSVLQRGPLQIAVSTSGASPLTARDIRLHLADEYDKHWERYLLLMAEMRGMVMARISDEDGAHRRIFEALAASDLEHRIAAGDDMDSRQVYELYVEPLLDPGTDIEHVQDGERA